MPEKLIWNAIKTPGLSLFQVLYFFWDVSESEFNKGAFINGSQ
jgi:hypothetical protein